MIVKASWPFLLLASETETEREWWAWAIHQVRHRGRGGRLEVAFAWLELDQGRRKKKDVSGGGLSQVRRIISIGRLCWAFV